MIDKQKHLLNVADLIINKPEVYKKLMAPEPKNRTKTGQGTQKPRYAYAGQKTIINLTGANVILLEEIIERKIDKLDRDPKYKEITKTGVINEIIEQWFDANKDKI